MECKQKADLEGTTRRCEQQAPLVVGNTLAQKTNIDKGKTALNVPISKATIIRCCHAKNQVWLQYKLQVQRFKENKKRNGPRVKRTSSKNDQQDKENKATTWGKMLKLPSLSLSLPHCEQDTEFGPHYWRFEEHAVSRRLPSGVRPCGRVDYSPCLPWAKKISTGPSTRSGLRSKWTQG